MYTNTNNIVYMLYIESFIGLYLLIIDIKY